MCKISVIVPVYNAEKYIKRCIDSVLNQSYKKFELILVDDGSNDSSGSICDEYAEKYAEIKVIHKANEGVSAARNTGLDIANGDYVIFIDSDDYIKENYFESVIEIVSDYRYDIIGYNNYKVYEDHIEEVLRCKKSIGVKNISDNIGAIKNLISSFIWAKAFKKDIIQRNNLRFDTEYSLGEDTKFLYQYIYYIDSFYASNKPMYYYNKTNSGTLSTKYVSNMASIIAATLNEYDRLIDKNSDFRNVFIETGRYAVILSFFIDNINMSNRKFKLIYNDCKDFMKVFSKYTNEDFISKNQYGKILTPVLKSKNPFALAVFLKLRGKNE